MPAPPQSAHTRLPGLRLALFYAAFFLVVGIHLPFWPVWLAARGLGPVEIGLLAAIGLSVRVLANPVIGHVADRRGERRRPMIVLAVAAVASFVLFAGADGFVVILLVSLAFYPAWSGIMPLAESLTMLTARARSLDYGRIRLWGSLTFIAGAAGAGHLLTGRSPDLVYALVLGTLVLTVAACVALPDTRAPVHEGRRLPLRAVLADRRIPVLLLAAALIQGSHAVYYAFGTLHWQAAGYDEATIGWLWAEGVIAEIILFAFGNRVVAAVGPARLVLLGGVAGLLRWTVLGSTDALPALIAVQALHAGTFGAAHLGAIHFITRTVSPTLSATAQGLYSSVVIGLGLGLAAAAAGPLYQAFGGRAYLAMAAMGAMGAVLAWTLHRATRRDPESPMTA